MAFFAQFTDLSFGASAPVIINADHVVFVRTYNGRTHIFTTATTDGGQSRSFIVEETEREVWRALVPTPGRT